MTGKTQTIGTRAQVWHGTAKKTSGGLIKSDLMMNKSGRIVSKAKHFSAKKEQRLLKYGYGTQKGKFGFVKVGSRKHRKGHKKMKGGHVNIGVPLSSAGIDGQGITDYSNYGSIGVQEAAGMAGGKKKGCNQTWKRIHGDFQAIADVASTKMKKTQCGGNVSMPLSPAGIDGQGITNYGASGSDGVQLAAGMAGGRRRHRSSRSMRGGSGMVPLSSHGSSNWNGDGIAGAGITVGNAGSANLQLLAGMAGGKKRRRRAMMGGTTKPFPELNGSPLDAALQAS